jgi:purine-binding chemotaxis protein CheW
MEKQFVSFEILQNKYCIDIMDVKEVVRENNITRMPDSPFFVEGIMNLRNIVIPVISIQKKLGIENKSNADGTKSDHTNKSKVSNKLIIVSIEGVLIGFTVDILDRVFSIDTAQIQTPEKIADSGIDKALINGVIKIDDIIYLILDIKKMLDYEEKSFIQKEILE